MDTNNVALPRPATNSEPVLLSLEEAEAVGAGIGPAAAFAAGVLTGAAVAGASLVAGAAVAAAGVAAYNAVTSSGSDDKKPIIAPGT